MTGFARADGVTDLCAWAWEAKSVNGKGLDVRVRLPKGFDALEAPVRDEIAARFKRGNIALSLDLAWSRPLSQVRVNEEVLDQVLAAAERVSALMPGATPPSVDGLLGLKGVLEQIDEEPGADEREQLQGDVMAGLAQVLDQLADGREAEGQRLGAVLHDQIADIETLAERAGELASMQPDAIRNRLVEQIQVLTGEISALDPERLAQEAALIMTKADVREELDRLSAHVAAARHLMTAPPAGRKLDFLLQEFMREANTLCSKSATTALTGIGLELKAVIEQLREQVQNVE